ncbi:chromosome segregation protein SMC [Paenisporosarcina sp. TG20]|uniref:chromosome segregation protein SMC n=1 Tax=Paenisporosarcina sp. TG20 TaxID=1211706 RepID=UPI0002E45708|nr:chromosome segregation protein SMC [Paenisporosarcina sp. TG20]
MFLKRLEVIGFKSFADRIGIDFVPGVTAVVGPNGSGKSNVTDAIRWVLGEQSAKSLRGAKMEDVIFAGSESRKPLNFAEVTLILDNSDQRLPLDYNEVSVTRRVFRSGDSEYLLNKQTCRLKDITDLFMDSGLGKEAFSIISQGRVDEILNSRPEDRRAIFEEAAGVLKYKLRKKKAEHKLFETDDNLHRVLDILHELDERMEPLQMQASSASDYLRMSEELKEIDLGLIAYDLNSVEKRLGDLKLEVENYEHQQKELEDVIEKKDHELQSVRTQLINQDKLIDDSQESLVEASSELERWDGRKQLMAEKRHNMDQQLDKLRSTTIELQQEKFQLTTDIEQKHLEKTKTSIELRNVQSEVKKLGYMLKQSSSEIEEEIENSKSNYIDLLNEEATVKNELKHLEQQLLQQHEFKGKMTNENAKIKAELAITKEQKKQVEQQLSDIRSQIDEILTHYKELQQTFSKEKETLESKQAMLYQAYQHQQQLKARKESLEALEADFSGFFQGVKEVLVARQNGHLKGITGAVAELIQVKPGYAKALETALGGAMQHIATETDQDARKAIAFLKNKRSGRATFLPKTVMKSRKIQSETLYSIKSHPSFIQTADEVVTFDQASKSIVENLLGNVIVVKDIQGASEIAKSIQYRYRVVTLDGDIVNAGGSLTGGFTKQQSSVFSRKAELDELSVKLLEMDQSIQVAENQVTNLKKIIDSQADRLENLKSNGEESRAHELELSSNSRELETTFKRLNERVYITNSETKDVLSQHEQAIDKKKQAQERLLELKQELDKINETIIVLTNLKSKNLSERDALTEQMAELRLKQAVLTEQQKVSEQTIAELQEKQQKVTLKLDNAEKEMLWYTSGDNQMGPTPDEIELQLADWMKKKHSLIQVIEEGKEKRSQIHIQLQHVELQLKKNQHLLKQQLDGLRAVEIKISRLDVEQSTLQMQLEDNYHLTIEDLEIPNMDIFKEEIARKKVKLLKRSIEELGPVNIASIEEFDRVSERHAFLTEQSQDLLDAKSTLHEAIKEMDQEMTMRFSETFYAIRDHFGRVFRELFGGGQADLVLTNSSDMLETGIDIIAQPPGKKQQHLNLLSGGERALTAIALLFAILNTRPVPFCILDEVEASLDETNVVRYSQYLKKFSHDTQFIVITHRKGTMEGADVLYGITMQESGISKLVSVKMQEDKKPTLVTQGSGNA